MPFLQRSWPTWFLRLLHLWRARQVDDLDRAFGGVYRVKPIGFMNIIFSPLVLIGSLPNKCLGMGTAKQNRRVFTAFHLEWLVYKISMPRISHKSEQIQPSSWKVHHSVQPTLAMFLLLLLSLQTPAKTHQNFWQKYHHMTTYHLSIHLSFYFGGSIRWEFEKHQLIHYPFSTKLINHHVLGLARPWSSSDLVTRGGNATISCENPVIFEQ